MMTIIIILFSIIKAPARVAGQRRCNYCYFQLFLLFLFDWFFFLLIIGAHGRVAGQRRCAVVGGQPGGRAWHKFWKVDYLLVSVLIEPGTNSQQFSTQWLYKWLYKWALYVFCLVALPMGNICLRFRYNVTK